MEGTGAPVAVAARRDQGATVAIVGQRSAASRRCGHLVSSLLCLRVVEWGAPGGRLVGTEKGAVRGTTGRAVAGG